jgi:hypothetical protein
MTHLPRQNRSSRTVVDLTLQHTNHTVLVEGPEITIRPVGTRRLATLVASVAVCSITRGCTSRTTTGSSSPCSHGIRSRECARDVDDRDSELVRQVKDETDLLKEISPSQNDLIEVAHSFEEVLETLGDRVAARYGQNQRGWEEDRGVYSAPWINTGFSYAPDYLTWVYCGAKGTKIGDALRHQLVGRGLGLPPGS